MGAAYEVNPRAICSLIAHVYHPCLSMMLKQQRAIPKERELRKNIMTVIPPFSQQHAAPCCQGSSLDFLLVMIFCQRAVSSTSQHLALLGWIYSLIVETLIPLYFLQNITHRAALISTLHESYVDT